MTHDSDAQATPDFTGPSTRCETRQALVAAMQALSDDALRTVVAYVPALDDGLWSSAELIAVVRTFLTGRSQREWRLLVRDTRGIATEHGPLIALAQRLPSLLLLRQADPDHALPARQAFVANDAGLLLLFDADQRPGAVFARDDRGRARKLVEAHDQAWDRARSLSELRSLGI